jgi:hypothetical protein
MANGSPLSIRRWAVPIVGAGMFAVGLLAEVELLYLFGLLAFFFGALAVVAGTPDEAIPLWLLNPWTATAYLIALVLLVSALGGKDPVPGIGLWSSIIAAILVYKDARARSELDRTRFWWTFGVVVLGPLVFLPYSLWRRGRGDRTMLTGQEATAAQTPALPEGSAEARNPSTPTHPPSTKPPGWYDDPWQQARVRYWNGYEWTTHLG